MKKQEDQITNYIDQHRQEFDDAVPDYGIWLDIERRIHSGKPGRVVPFMIFKIASLLVLVLACGILIGVNLTGNRNNAKMDYSASPELIQFRDAETYYQTQVNLKLGQLKNQGEKALVLDDLKQLDIIYHDLRQEMIHSGYSNSGVLINAMITNYKTRIDILENILNKQNIPQNETEPISL